MVEHPLCLVLTALHNKELCLVQSGDGIFIIECVHPLNDLHRLPYPVADVRLLHPERHILTHEPHREVLLLASCGSLRIYVRTVPCDYPDVQLAVRTFDGYRSEVSSLMKPVPDDRELDEMIVADKITYAESVFFKPQKVNIR